MIIIPVTKARSRLSDLVKKADRENYFVLTKGGEPEAALVDYEYLLGLEEKVKKLYQKTFIDSKFDKYTRVFSDEEIERWQKEDEI